MSEGAASLPPKGLKARLLAEAAAIARVTDVYVIKDGPASAHRSSCDEAGPSGSLEGVGRPVTAAGEPSLDDIDALFGTTDTSTAASAPAVTAAGAAAAGGVPSRASVPGAATAAAPAAPAASAAASGAAAASSPLFPKGTLFKLLPQDERPTIPITAMHSKTVARQTRVASLQNLVDRSLDNLARAVLGKGDQPQALMAAKWKARRAAAIARAVALEQELSQTSLTESVYKQVVVRALKSEKIAEPPPQSVVVAPARAAVGAPSAPAAAAGRAQPGASTSGVTRPARRAALPPAFSQLSLESRVFFTEALEAREVATRLLFLPLRKKAADEEWQEQDEEAEQTAADAAGVPPGEEHAAADAQADPVEARSSVPEDPGPSGSAGAPSGSGGDGGGGSTSATGSAPAADDEDPPGSRKRPRGATGSAGRWDPPDGGSKKRAAGLLPAEPGPAPAPPEAPAAPASSAGPASRHMAAAEHVRRLVEEHVNRRLEPYVADGRLSDLGRSVIAVKAAGKLVHHHASHVARGDASFLQSHARAIDTLLGGYVAKQMSSGT